ncbi:class I SAM-dependent methyltransferase [Micromonospora sp. RP3T]|uniref:class I SAM-dependent methyltransferase n=1 Tax=Micromonospora sp. RP3T TaxID=2135446 RepID=UPI003D75CBF0
MLENLRTLGRVIRTLATKDPVTRVRRFYEIQSPDVEFAARTSRYMNVGYWEEGVTSIDVAAQALADKLADAAGFKPDDTVVDVGFGYGDQDFAWLRDRRVAKVHGINVTPRHVEHAQERARREGLADRADFQLGTATALPFPDASVDRVVALESAFHFHPRSAFFAEAFRVLRPGGTIATADIIPLSNDTPRMSISSGPLSFVKFSLPDENWHDRKTYGEQLAAAGFGTVEVHSIADRTWEGWRRFQSARPSDPAFRAAADGSAVKGMANHWRDTELIKKELGLLDYVIAVAQKP